MEDLSRRGFLFGMGAFTCCSLVGWSKLSLASVPTDQRLLVIIQRGAMDGLAAVAPFGDKSYHGARGGLALPDTALLNLNGYFAMHTALKSLHKYYEQKQMVVLHATATPYRSRSHFDAQDLLENGSSNPHGLTTGWLGRTIEVLQNVEGLALGPTVPLVLGGSKHVESWAPSALPQADGDFLLRVSRMYEHDPLLSNALKQAMETQDVAYEPSGKKGGRQQFVDMMKAAAKFMTAPKGARIATIDIGGWDTHLNQGTESGRLAQNFELLGGGIDAFCTGMGEMWNKTAVLVITEFGRTVAANGTGGSDHGTGSTAFLLGGSVKGGRVIGDWPGLAAQNLYEGRDLYPANDLRSLLKGVVGRHLGVSEEFLNREIFPQSETVPAYRDLFV